MGDGRCVRSADVRRTEGNMAAALIYKRVVPGGNKMASVGSRQSQAFRWAMFSLADND